MKSLTLRVSEEFVARVDRALRAEGLEVREFVKAGEYRLEVANAIGGAPGVPRLLQYDAPKRLCIWCGPLCVCPARRSAA